MFFILWRGWGILVPFIPMLSILIMIVVSSAILDKETLQENMPIILANAMMLATLGLWKFGKYVNKTVGVDQYTNNETGEVVVLNKKKHHLFFIPIQWWAIPTGLIALLLVVMVFIYDPQNDLTLQTKNDKEVIQGNLNELLPKNILIQMSSKLLDSAAGDEIKDLTLQYNRAHQAYITKELTEIISGAEAV